MGPDVYRKDRIERLLADLRHEIERGVIHREIPEAMDFKFIVPVSDRGPGYVVSAKFQMRTIPTTDVELGGDGGGLRVIEGGKS